MTVREGFEDFIKDCIRREHTKKTIKDYQEICLPFVQYLGEQKDINKIDIEDIKEYQDIIRKRKISKASYATYTRTIKAFLKYLKKYYEIPLRTNLISIPKTPKKILPIYGSEELSQIAEAVTAEREWITVRNKTMILFMYDSGLRRNELVELRWDCIYNDGTMKVYGKGNKERYVPLGDVAQRFLEKYRRLCPYENEMVFVDRRGYPITENAIKLFINKVSKKLPFRLSCHMLRHNFATNYCLDQYKRHGNIDVYRLKTIMGHEQIETTLKYMHVAENIIASRENISHIDNMISSIHGWTP